MSNTVPGSRHGECDMKWCDETAGHDGLHTCYLGDLAGIETTSGRRATLQALLTGTSIRDRHVELIAANASTVRMLLTWPQVTWLSTLLDDTVRRYG